MNLLLRFSSVAFRHSHRDINQLPCQLILNAVGARPYHRAWIDNVSRRSVSDILQDWTNDFIQVTEVNGSWFQPNIKLVLTETLQRHPYEHCHFQLAVSTRCQNWFQHNHSSCLASVTGIANAHNMKPTSDYSGKV